MIAVARRKNSGLEAGKVQLLVAKAQSLPFPEYYFDAVFCLNSLGLLGNDIEALSEMKRVLKPGGTLRCNVMPAKRKQDDFLRNLLQRLPGAKTENANHLLGALFRLVCNNVLIEWIKPR